MQNPVNLLYVDDEEINLELFKMTFEDNFNIHLARSGMEGLDVLQKNKSIQVVISDMRMPKMDGIEFIKKARDQFKHICCHILTGFDINDEIENSMKEGLIRGYFRKPLNRNEILTGIINSLNN